MAERTLGTGTALVDQPVATHMQVVAGLIVAFAAVLLPMATDANIAIHIHRVRIVTRMSGVIVESVDKLWVTPRVSKITHRDGH